MMDNMIDIANATVTNITVVDCCCGGPTLTTFWPCLLQNPIIFMWCGFWIIYPFVSYLGGGYTLKNRIALSLLMLSPFLLMFAFFLVLEIIG